MERKVIKTRTAEVWLGEDGILRTIYVLPQAELELEDALEIAAARETVTGGRKYSLLVDARNVKAVSRESRMHGRSAEVAQSISALAGLVSNPVTRMLANFFMKVDRPPYPMQIFASEEDAIEWLRQFVE